ncbi:hypothetical protein ACOMHN_016643 [Nucella lapillus]
MSSSAFQGSEPSGSLGLLSNLSDGGAQAGLMPWDTSDPFSSYGTRVLMQGVLRCYVRQAIVLIGIPANVMCLVVFFKQGLSDKINLLLFWLAVADQGNLLGQALLMPGCYLTDKTLQDNWEILVNFKISILSWWLGNLSGILIVIVSVNRCLSVVLPLRAKRLLGYRPTVIMIALCYVMSLMVFLPSFLAFTIGYETDLSTNRSMAYVDDTTWFPIDGNMAFKVVHYFFIVALPVLQCLMVVCCIITIVHLRQASRQRLKMTGNVTEEAKAGQNRITVMLLVICGVYFVLTLPETSFAILVVLVPGFHVYEEYHNTNIITYEFIYMGICLNSATNFFVYAVLSSRFRRTLKNCFVALCKRDWSWSKSA